MLNRSQFSFDVHRNFGSGKVKILLSLIGTTVPLPHCSNVLLPVPTMIAYTKWSRPSSNNRYGWLLTGTKTQRVSIHSPSENTRNGFDGFDRAFKNWLKIYHSSSLASFWTKFYFISKNIYLKGHCQFGDKMKKSIAHFAAVGRHWSHVNVPKSSCAAHLLTRFKCEFEIARPNEWRVNLF